MRATLHRPAPNTYYGQWTAEKAAVCRARTASIAHYDVVASARFGAFDGGGRDFPANRAEARAKFVFRPNKNFRQAATRALGIDSTASDAVDYSLQLFLFPLCEVQLINHEASPQKY